MTYDFFKAVREDTGRHMLDSGGAYGRHHESPPVATDDPEVTWDPKWMDCSATISTAHLLSNFFTIRQDLMKQFDKWVESHEGSWFEAGDEFMHEVMGYVSVARDNVCNSENDLSQVYVYEVWRPEDAEDREWIYADDAIVVLHIHTGCDIRGGYTRPYFCEGGGDGGYVIPFDLSAEYRIEESHTMSEDAMREVDESWSAGYSSYPLGQVEERVKRWFPWLSTTDSRVALLDTGDVVRITAYMPYYGG